MPDSNAADSNPVAFTKTGEGPAIILTHGLGDSVGTWTELLPHLEDFECWTWDMLGHGASPKPSEDDAYSMQRALDDLEAMIERAGREVVLIGHSLGGYLSQHRAVRDLTNLRGLVLIATGPGYRDPDRREEWNGYVHKAADTFDIPASAAKMALQHDELVMNNLEAIKVPPLGELEETAEVLFDTFTAFLKLFHPYLPFVTEQLWGELGGEGLLMSAAWPPADAAHDYPAEAEGVDAVVALVAAARGVRSEQGLEPGVKVEVEVHPRAHAESFEACREIVARLVRAETLTFTDTVPHPEGATVAVDPDFEVAVRLGEADRAAERARFEKQLEEGRKRLAGLEKRLANENFVTRAKPEAVEKTRRGAEDERARIAALEKRLA